MEPEGVLPHSQAPAICPYPEPDQSSTFLPHPIFLEIHFNIILPSMPRSSKWSLLFQVSPPKCFTHLYYHPVEVVRCTFTHKQNIEQRNLQQNNTLYKRTTQFTREQHNLQENNTIYNRTTQFTTEQHNLQQNNTIYNLTGKSAGRAPSLRVIPWHLPYNWGTSTEKPQVRVAEECQLARWKPK